MVDCTDSQSPILGREDSPGEWCACDGLAGLRKLRGAARQRGGYVWRACNENAPWTWACLAQLAPDLLKSLLCLEQFEEGTAGS